MCCGVEDRAKSGVIPATEAVIAENERSRPSRHHGHGLARIAGIRREICDGRSSPPVLRVIESRLLAASYRLLATYPQSVHSRGGVLFGKAAHGGLPHCTMWSLTFPPEVRGPLSLVLTVGVAKGTR